MSKSKFLNVRSRCWSLVLYDNPLETFSSLLPQILHYVYIFHDSDVTSSGKPKEPHYHLLFVLRNAKTLSSVLTFHSTSTNVLGESVHNKTSMYRYLRHLDNPDDFQYPYESLISDNLSFWDNLNPDFVSTSDGEKALTMLEDILAHKPYRELVLLYGRDLIRNFSTYQNFAIAMKADDYRRSQSPTLPDPVECDLLEIAKFHESFD